MLRLLLVPGFTQAAGTWDGVIAGLRARNPATGCQVSVLALPRRLDFAAGAVSLAEQGGRGVYIGYSMGGRLCLRAALDRPELVTGLVLVSSTPGIADPSARARRLEEDERLARRIEEVGVRDFVGEWLRRPMFSKLGATAPEVERRAAAHDVEALAHQARALGQGAQEPLWGRLHELSAPCLIVAGEEDDKYRAIAEQMSERIAGSRLSRLPGGHSLPLEQPALLASVIADWLDGGGIGGGGAGGSEADPPARHDGPPRPAREISP